MSFYNNEPKQSHSSPLTFPSYNNQSLNHKSNLSALSAATLSEKVNQPLNNLKHRLPLPQESQHHQHSIHQHTPSTSTGQISTSQNQSSQHGSDQTQHHLHDVPPNTLNKEGMSKEGSVNPPKKERKNKPGQKFGAKKKSWVWSWFVQDSQDPNIAACDYCGKIITRLPSDKGSPKKLSEHLKTHKLDASSINDTRPIPIDGNGVTYNSNGTQMTFNNHSSQAQQQQQIHNSQQQRTSPQLQQQQTQQPHQQSLQHQLQQHSSVIAPQLQQQQQQGHNPSSSSQLNSLVHGAGAVSLQDQMNAAQRHRGIGNAMPIQDPLQLSFNLNQNNRRFLSADFDNTPYTSQKFQRHLLKFLTENKLSINVIKSHSFQQIIYDLRSDSVNELTELTNLYSTLLEVSRFDSNQVSNSMSTAEEANVANTIAQAVEKGHEP